MPPALLAVAIAAQARIAAERAAMSRDVRHACPARSAAHAFAGALDALERLVLADRTAELAAVSRRTVLSVPGTVTPAERAWVLAWHLLVASNRLHSGASAGGRPVFGERDSRFAVTRSRRAIGELSGLLSSQRQRELRANLTLRRLSLDAQLELFAPVLPRC